MSIFDEYTVYIKSHCEAPDYEEMFTKYDLIDNKMKCQIRYSDDGEVSYKCGGELVKNEDDHIVCGRCSEHYVKS